MIEVMNANGIPPESGRIDGAIEIRVSRDFSDRPAGSVVFGGIFGGGYAFTSITRQRSADHDGERVSMTVRVDANASPKDSTAWKRVYEEGQRLASRFDRSEVSAAA